MKKLSLLLVMLLAFTVSTTAQSLPKPANPSPDDWLEWGTSMEQFSFTLGTDIMGQPVADDYTIDKFFNNEEYTILDEEKVSYSIYTDNDQIFTFTPEEFPDDVTEETTEIPFGYDGIKMDASYCIYFEDRPVGNVTEGRFFEWRIGVQMHYTDNGQKSSSDIVYMEIIPQLQEAKEVTSTSFLADWSCYAENTYMRSNFDGYDLYVINKNTQDTIVINNVTPTNSYQDDWGNTHYLPGATCNVEGLTPGATYEFYVAWRHNKTANHTVYSAMREVTLPLPETVYILGEVNEQRWAPNAGTPMEYDAENNVYTATINCDGRNEGYNYFSFTTRVAENDDQGGWDYILPYRFGAVSDGDFLVTDELLGVELSMETNGDAYKIPAGKYELTVDLAKMKLIIEKVTQGHGYELGDVDHDGSVNISDVTTLIDYLLGTGEVCEICADVSVDESINISDVTALIDLLLAGPSK